MTRGLLVIIDGIDGSGKTTQVRMLKEHLVAEQIACTASCEPTTGPWGTKLRRSALEGRLEPEEELEVICNDRFDDVTKCIKPALMRGEIVIVDRYYTSTLCYQTIRGLSAETILARNQRFAPVPDLVFILDVSRETAFNRIASRGQPVDRFEAADLDLVREKFQALNLPGLMHLDGNRPVADIHHTIYSEVVRALQTLGLNKEASTMRIEKPVAS